MSQVSNLTEFYFVMSEKARANYDLELDCPPPHLLDLVKSVKPRNDQDSMARFASRLCVACSTLGIGVDSTGLVDGTGALIYRSETGEIAEVGEIDPDKERFNILASWIIGSLLIAEITRGSMVHALNLMPEYYYRNSSRSQNVLTFSTSPAVRGGCGEGFSLEDCSAMSTNRFTRYGHGLKPIGLDFTFDNPKLAIINALSLIHSFYDSNSQEFSITEHDEDPKNKKLVEFSELIESEGQSAVVMLGGFINTDLEPVSIFANFYRDSSDLTRHMRNQVVTSYVHLPRGLGTPPRPGSQHPRLRGCD